MSTSEERARAVIEQVKAELPSAWLGGRQHGVLITAIADALQAERAAVWGKASKKFDEKFYATDRRLDLTRDYRVDEFYNWLRIKAKKAQVL